MDKYQEVQIGGSPTISAILTEYVECALSKTGMHAVRVAVSKEGILLHCSVECSDDVRLMDGIERLGGKTCFGLLDRWKENCFTSVDHAFPEDSVIADWQVKVNRRRNDIRARRMMDMRTPTVWDVRSELVTRTLQEEVNGLPVTIKFDERELRWILEWKYRQVATRKWGARGWMFDDTATGAIVRTTNDIYVANPRTGNEDYCPACHQSYAGPRGHVRSQKHFHNVIRLLRGAMRKLPGPDRRHR